jgi:2-polyprenyl-3-methyl-5-hydroxy-6-metoxy-1,4-benzoquinol methylase
MSDLKQNVIYNELIELGIIHAESIVQFYPKVRDREDVGVLRCNTSGVIFLDRTDHVDFSYYSEKEGASYWSAEDRNSGLKEVAEDNNRHLDQIKEYIIGKKYVDVGSGLGGILDLAKPFAKEIYAVEPQRDIRNNLQHLGYSTFASVTELTELGTKFDFISLFHVFEHVTDPLKSLKLLNSTLLPGGKIFIEVPHAGDALINAFNLDSFKKFTFWSEHIILHTRKSLETYLKAAGFKNIKVSGVQRYPLANHFSWLRDGKPGGQKLLTGFRDAKLEAAYNDFLERTDQTDTIIAIAEKA